MSFKKCCYLFPHNKIVILARSKLNSIVWFHEDFELIINEERNYWELKERIRMMESQRSDTEKINLIEEGKK